MGVFTDAAVAVEDMFAWFGSFVVPQDLAGMCQLETSYPGDEHTLINRHGVLMSMIRIDGSLLPVADSDLNKMVGSISEKLSSVLCKGSPHYIDVAWELNDPRTPRDLVAMYNPYVQQIRRIGMHPFAEKMFVDEMRSVRKYVSSESCYWLVYTTLRTISDVERKADNISRAELNKKYPIGRLDHAQGPMATMQSAFRSHRSVVSSIVDLLKQTLVASAVEQHEAVRIIRTFLDEDHTADAWKPVLPGDKIPIRKMRRTDDGSGMLPPKLSNQMMSRPARVVPNTNYVQIGSRVCATTLLELPPQEDSKLFEHLRQSIRRDIPWRMLIRVTPDGLASQRIKQLWLMLVGWIGENKQMKRSLDWLNEYVENDGCAVGMQVAFQTFGNSAEAVDQNLRDLVQAIQGWGIASTLDDTGDPFGQFASGLPGFCSRHQGNVIGAPIEQVVPFFPLQRPATIWRTGLPFRSLDGKPYPFNPISSDMTFLLAYYMAPPGSGKSVFMGRVFWSTALAPTGLPELSPIGSIDIGPTQVMQAKLLRELLPPEMKSQVLAAKLRESIDQRINPGDTLPGCRYPTELQREFLLYLLMLLCTPLPAEREPNKAPYPMMDNLASVVIAVAYRRCASPETAKAYQPDVETMVDEAIKQHKIKVDEYTTWWEVVDALWAAGSTVEAMRAQRYAVPTLVDFISAAQSDDAVAVYGKEGKEARVDVTGMSLIDQFVECLQAAMRDYPLISSTTTFDLGVARVIALDLDDIARGSGPRGERRIALYMMMTYSLFAQRWFRKVRDNAMDEIYTKCPDIYHAWHLREATRMQEVRKTLIMDELHRSGSAASFRSMLGLAGREGRKWGIDFHFASQLPDDLPDELRAQCTAVYVLDGKSADVVDGARNLFKFCPEAVRHLERYCVGATSAGAPFLVRYQTNRGRVEQVLVNTMGDLLLWNTNTTPEDMTLRDRVMSKLGHVDALLALSSTMGTSAKSLIQRRRLAAGGETSNVYDVLADEIVDRWTKDQAAAGRASAGVAK